MGFAYRRNTSGDTVQPVKEYVLDTAYAATAKRQDVVKLNASGQVVLAATGDTEVLGVLEYIDVNALGETTHKGGVRTDGSAIYEVAASAAGAVVGAKYGITMTDGGIVNVADTATACVVVVRVRDNGNLDVQITGRQLT